MTVGETIRRYRKAKGLTQKNLAEITQLNEVTIRSYEAGKYKPKIEQLQKISTALDVHISEFLDELNENERIKATWEWIQDNQQKRKELIIEILKTHNYKIESLGTHAILVTDYNGKQFQVRNKSFDEMIQRSDNDIKYNLDKLLHEN
jgi:transcriptional regulator with XRE-family HTH domain